MAGPHIWGYLPLGTLAVLFGAVGVWLDYPLADPIVGLLTTIAILKIVWDSSKSVFIRLLDGVDPANASGPEYHRIQEHEHDDLPAHSH